jgi:nitric oxide dioxygenase
MALSETQIRLVQDSLPMIRAHLEPASMVFYDNLFAIAPETRALFREDLVGQGMKFFSTLDTIVELLHDMDALDSEVADLARSHASLGVMARHFEPMGSALMVTLGETVGTKFTEELRDAWRAAYDEISRRMVAAARMR